MKPKTIYPEGQGVYAIRNTGNCRAYYGRGEFHQRFRQHLNALRQSKHINRELQHDWNEYGESSFVFEVVERVEVYWRRAGTEEEIRAILSDPNCYNCDSYGYTVRQKGDYPIPNPYRNNGPLKSKHRK